MFNTANLFANIPADMPEEIVEVLRKTGAMRIERIVSRGHVSSDGTWYDQEMDEWVLLLQGAARLRFEGDDRPVELKPGDYLNIPAHRRHRVEWTTAAGPTIWLAIHYEAAP